MPPPCGCQANNGGTPNNPSTAHPIDILSGNKHFTVKDWANASGTLDLTREFNSLQGSGEVTLANARALGLANWLYDFQFELQIGHAWSTSGAVLLMTPDGPSPACQQNGSSLTLIPYTTGGYPTPQTDYTLAIIGYTPSGGALTAGWPSSLTAQPTTWTMTAPGDTVYTLQTLLDPATGAYTTARPVAITWRNGVSWTLTYGPGSELTSVTDNFGNAITFSWIYNVVYGWPLAIQSASLPGGYVINYNYTTVGPGVASNGSLPDLLTQVQYLDSTATVRDSTSYQYNNPSFPYYLTDIYDGASPTPVHRWGVTYDASGRATVSSVTGAAGAVQAYTVAYTGDTTPGAGGTFTRTVTNPLGKSSTYTYANDPTHGIQLTSVANAASLLSPASTISYSYGSDGFTSSITDENGHVETLTHDPRGMPAQTVEASGTSSARTITTTWDSVWRQPDSIVAPTVTTAFVYNSAGAATSKTLTDTTSFTTPYATNGRTRTWTYDWNSSGQLTAAHGPRWVSGGTLDTTSYGYNTNGYLASVTNALGQATTVTAWDWRGAPTSVTDANGVVTTLTYDVRGRLLTATVNPGSAQSLYQFTYDAVGDLTQVTLPMGATLTYAYDQGRRLTTVTNVRGETRTYSYDNDDDPLSLTTATAGAVTAQVHSAVYDDWGRILQSVGAASQAWNLAYDNLSNLTSVADPSLATGVAPNTRASTFDPLNRIISQTDPSGHSVGYSFDAADNLTGLTDARSLSTTREVDGFGEVIQEASPDRGTRSYWYDPSGNLTKLVDGDSVETDFAYDNANRRTSKTFPSDTAESTTFTYDQTSGGNAGVGRLTGVTEASGSTAFTYDAQGRLTADAKVISPSGYTTALTVQYGYDANGKVIQMTYPSGDVVNYTQTTDGLITAVTFTPIGGSAQTIASGVTFEPYGPIAGLTYGNGLVLTRGYDQDYRLTSLAVAPTSGAAVINLGFGWQADGRLASVNDSVGNRTPTATTATLMKASLATGANQVTGTTTLGGTTARTLTYRTGGDLTQDIRGSVTYGYSYNAAKRLTTVTQNGTTVGNYAYDFAGRRVWRQTYGASAAQTAYVYDPDGHLLAEHNATTGVVTREYVWIDDMAVALADISGSTVTIGYIHTGQIDEPLEVTNASQAVVWNGYVDPFGNGSLFTSPSTTLDMRLPGQSFQLEPGSLNQNGYRDYDPSLGRYIEADPLGIEAGQNVYGYVDGDPVDLMDPTGLQTVTITGPAGSSTFPIPLPVAEGFCAIFPGSCSVHPSDSNAPPADSSKSSRRSNICHCSPETQRYLQQQVTNICKPEPRMCRAGDSCLSMVRRASQFNACAAARKDVMDDCFAGGDRGHQIKYTQMRQAADICSGLMATCVPK